MDSKCRHVRLRELNRLTLTLNVAKLFHEPSLTGLLHQQVYDIVVDKQVSVQEFRDMIVEKLKLPKEFMFRMTKTHAAGSELNEFEKKMVSLSFPLPLALTLYICITISFTVRLMHTGRLLCFKQHTDSSDSWRAY